MHFHVGLCLTSESTGHVILLIAEITKQCGGSWVASVSVGKSGLELQWP